MLSQYGLQWKSNILIFCRFHLDLSDAIKRIWSLPKLFSTQQLILLLHLLHLSSADADDDYSHALIATTTTTTSRNNRNNVIMCNQILWNTCFIFGQVLSERNNALLPKWNILPDILFLFRTHLISKSVHLISRHT